MAVGTADNGGKTDGACFYLLMKGGRKERKGREQEREWEKEEKKIQKLINTESWQQHPISVPMTWNSDFQKWFAHF